MDWFWAFLFGGDENGSKEVPPVHPNQSFHNFCERISRSDAALKDLVLQSDDVLNIDILAKALAKNSSIETLRINLGRYATCPGASLPSAPDSISRLCEGICYLSAPLTSLSFSGTSLRLSHVQPICLCLQAQSFLDIFDLTGCNIGDNFLSCMLETCVDKGIQADCVGCIKLGKNGLTNGALLARTINLVFGGIQTLCLDGNQYTNAEVEQMVQFTETKVLEHLSYLNLSDNLILLDGGKLGSLDFLRVLVKECSSLSKLDLDGNVQATNNFGPVVPIIRDFSSILTYVSLENCDLGDQHVKTMVQALEEHPRRISPLLQELNLSRNFITSRGAVLLVEATMLTRRLMLSNCLVDDRSGIVNVLRETNFILEHLDLKRNRIRTSASLVTGRFLREDIDFWLRLNGTKIRRMLANQDALPLSLWSWVMKRVVGQPDFIFFVLRNFPALVRNGSLESR